MRFKRTSVVQLLVSSFGVKAISRANLVFCTSARATALGVQHLVSDICISCQHLTRIRAPLRSRKLRLAYLKTILPRGSGYKVALLLLSPSLNGILRSRSTHSLTLAPRSLPLHLPRDALIRACTLSSSKPLASRTISWRWMTLHSQSQRRSKEGLPPRSLCASFFSTRVRYKYPTIKPPKTV